MFKDRRRPYCDRLKAAWQESNAAISIGLFWFDDVFALNLFGLLLPIPFVCIFLDEGDCKTWGITLWRGNIHVEWGEAAKVIITPFDQVVVTIELLMSDGSWVEWDFGSPLPEGAWNKTWDLGNAISGISYIDRREWRPRCLRWCSLFASKKRFLHLERQDPDGVKIGCELTKRETILATFNRMVTTIQEQEFPESKT